MNSPPRTLAAVGVVGLVVVVVGGAWRSAEAIQQQAELNAQKALGAARITDVAVTADGADITLAGQVETDLARARAVLDQAPGVGRVHVAPQGDAGTQGPRPDTPSSVPSPPSSSPAQASVSGTTPGAVDSIEFGPGSADLSDEARAQVTSVVTYMHSEPEVTLALIGTAGDESGRDEVLALSAQRAQNVAEAVITGGIDASRVSYSGSASLVPAGDTSEERRVDVVYEER